MRVFFAVWPDREASERLATLSVEVAARTRGRSPRAGNLHMTLAFVGEVPSQRIGALCAIGASVASRAMPFVLTLDSGGTFRRSGIAWAGASMPPPQLGQIVRDLADALSSQDFRVEQRTFAPHVTLARRCRVPALAGLSAPIAWIVTRLVLNASEPARDGQRYEEIASWPLAAAHSPPR